MLKCWSHTCVFPIAASSILQMKKDQELLPNLWIITPLSISFYLTPNRQYFNFNTDKVLSSPSVLLLSPILLWILGLNFFGCHSKCQAQRRVITATWLDLGWRSLSLTTTSYLSGHNWQVLMSSKASQVSSGFSTPISPRHILGTLNKHRQWDFVTEGAKAEGGNFLNR